MYRPIVSNTLNRVSVVRMKKLSSLFQLSMKLSSVSWTTAGKTTQVIQNAQKNATISPWVSLSVFFVVFTKMDQEEEELVSSTVGAYYVVDMMPD